MDDVATLTLERDALAVPSKARWTRFYARGLAVSDAIVLVWTCVAMHLVWAAYEGRNGGDLAFSSEWLLATAGLFVVWMAALMVSDSRDDRVISAGPEEYKRVSSSTMLLFGIITVAATVTTVQLPRAYLVVGLPLGLVLLLASRWTWRQWALLRRRQGKWVYNVVVVGSRLSTGHLIDTLHRRWEAGYRVVAVCLTGINPDTSGTVHGVPVIDDVHNVAEQAAGLGADAVVVASSDQSHPDMVQTLGWNLEAVDIELMMAPALANIAGPRVHIRPAAGMPLLHVERPTYSGGRQVTKALFDRCGSLIGIILLSPAFLVLAIAVKVTSPGPVFFVQERVGLGGKPFGMLKFRSMVDGAENQLAALQADAGNARMFKMKKDPRVTEFGAFLRRYSLDELPQIFNVLIGDMSLVGPRPPLPTEVLHYEAQAHRRLLVRPGITGPWQVSGRSDLDWEETVRLDLYYVENWSLMSDLLILAKTFRAVVSSRGAY